MIPSLNLLQHIEPSFPNIERIHPDLDLPDTFTEISEVELQSLNPLPLYNLSELPYRPSTLLGPQPLMYLTFAIQGK